jgi:hypothetical protein
MPASSGPVPRCCADHRTGARLASERSLIANRGTRRAPRVIEVVEVPRDTPTSPQRPVVLFRQRRRPRTPCSPLPKTAPPPKRTGADANDTDRGTPAHAGRKELDRDDGQHNTSLYASRLGRNVVGPQRRERTVACVSCGGIQCGAMRVDGVPTRNVVPVCKRNHENGLLWQQCSSLARAGRRTHAASVLTVVLTAPKQSDACGEPLQLTSDRAGLNVLTVSGATFTYTNSAPTVANVNTDGRSSASAPARVDRGRSGGGAGGGRQPSAHRAIAGAKPRSRLPSAG